MDTNSSENRVQTMVDGGHCVRPKKTVHWIDEHESDILTRPASSPDIGLRTNLYSTRSIEEIEDEQRYRKRSCHCSRIPERNKSARRNRLMTENTQCLCSTDACYIVMIILVIVILVAFGVVVHNKLYLRSKRIY